MAWCFGRLDDVARDVHGQVSLVPASRNGRAIRVKAPSLTGKQELAHARPSHSCGAWRATAAHTAVQLNMEQNHANDEWKVHAPVVV
jgi:hypothetical protein